jgi:hypothetical protein
LLLSDIGGEAILAPAAGIDALAVVAGVEVEIAEIAEVVVGAGGAGGAGNDEALAARLRKSVLAVVSAVTLAAAVVPTADVEAE